MVCAEFGTKIKFDLSTFIQKFSRVNRAGLVTSLVLILKF